MSPLLAGVWLVAGCDPAGDGPDTTTGGTGTGGPDDCPLLDQADLADDLTVSAGCRYVSSMLQVTRRLDIEAGAELRFASSAGLVVGSDGVLAAVGTPDMPVLMTADGVDWMGLRFAGSASSENRLENVTVEQAADTAIQLDPGARLTVVGSTITGAGEIGLAATAGTELSVATTTFSANKLPLSVSIEVAHGLEADNVFDGNDRSFVQVESGTLGDPVQWNALPVPYRFTGDATVAAALTLSPGVVIEMPQDARFYVLDTGALTAAGTPEAPITIRGVQDERGYWMGISFASKTSDNVLSNCVVANGGSGQWNGDAESIGMVWLDDESKVQVSNCTLRASGGPALTIKPFLGAADIAGFADNTITGNRATLQIPPANVHQVASSNTFDGNDEAFIRVGRAGSAGPDRVLSEPATWLRQPIPYRVMEETFIESDLVIEAGTEIEVTQDTPIVVRDTGSLRAVGTAETPIVFRGVEPLQGYWQGIRFESQSTDNVFDYVDLMHGGSRPFTGDAESDGLIFLYGGSVTISNTSLSDSGGYGVTILGFNSGGALLGCAGVMFSNNAKGDVYLAPNANGTSECP